MSRRRLTPEELEELRPWKEAASLAFGEHLGHRSHERYATTPDAVIGYNEDQRVKDYKTKAAALGLMEPETLPMGYDADRDGFGMAPWNA